MNLRYSGSLLALRTIFCTAMLISVGCTKSATRELPWLAGKSSDSFKEMAARESDSASLTIWHKSYADARAAAEETGKPILADFTGSDWCTWCIKLKEDVFETAEFKAWARENVILLELDYPKRAIQTAEIRQQNAELKDRYNIDAFPTVLLIDSEGNAIGKLGYKKSATQWIAQASTFLPSDLRLAKQVTNHDGQGNLR